MLAMLGLARFVRRAGSCLVSLGFATVLLHAPASHALTYVEPAAFDYSGTVTFLTGPAMQGFTTGVSLYADVEIGEGRAFLTEPVERLADENLKLVLSGGGRAPGDATLQRSVEYTSWPYPVQSPPPNETQDDGSKAVTSQAVGELVFTEAGITPVPPSVFAGLSAP